MAIGRWPNKAWRCAMTGGLLVLDDATHWTLTDAAERVTQAMLDFFKALAISRSC